MTCHRFGPSRPVATNVGREVMENMVVKPPKTKAVTGHRTPKGLMLVTENFLLIGFS